MTYMGHIPKVLVFTVVCLFIFLILFYIILWYIVYESVTIHVYVLLGCQYCVSSTYCGMLFVHPSLSVFMFSGLQHANCLTVTIYHHHDCVYHYIVSDLNLPEKSLPYIWHCPCDIVIFIIFVMLLPWFRHWIWLFTFYAFLFFVDCSANNQDVSLLNCFTSFHFGAFSSLLCSLCLVILDGRMVT